MAEGIRAPNLPLGSSISEFLGLETVGAAKSVKRFTRAAVIGGIEAITNSFTVGGGVIFTTLSQALANLNYDAFKMAWVIQDTTPANNGVYQKAGTSGSGSWARLGDLPYSFYRAANEGAGTANAIKATNGYPMANKDALIVVNITATATASPVTLSLNGGAPLTIKTASGNDPAVGGLVAGMMVAGYIDGTEFRMISDQASSAIQAAAEAARDVAIAAAGAANTTTVTNIAALRNVAPSLFASVNTKGYYAAGDGGGASFAAVIGAAAGTYTHNGGSVILPNGGNGSAAWLARDPLLRALQWGCVGDGATDDSVTAQNFVDRNKGKRITFDAGRTFLIGGLLLTGSTYNNTELAIRGTLKVKARVSAADTNMQALVFVGIGVSDCDGVRIDGNFDGNRAAQYDIEQTFIICLAGVTNFKSDYLSFREVNGDGIYVTNKLITSNSANSDTLTFGTIIGENTADGGRNLMTVISGDNITIGTFKSTRIGGVVGGFQMPGGFDAEADNLWNSVKNLVIGTANIVTAGTGGFTLYALPTSGSVRSVNVGTLSVLNTAAPSVVDSFSNTTVTNNSCLLVRNCEDVSIASFKGEFTNAYGIGADIGNGINYNIKGTVRHASAGVALAATGADIYALADSVIDFDVHDIARYGFQIGNVNTSTVMGTVTDPKSTIYSARYGVITLGSRTNIELTMSVNITYAANWTRAYRNDASVPNVLTDCKIMNASFGINWPSYLEMVDMAVMVYNSPGYTDSALGVPTTGPRLRGQYNRNGNPVVGQPKGWYCTVAGTPGTLVSEGNL